MLPVRSIKRIFRCYVVNEVLVFNVDYTCDTAYWRALVSDDSFSLMEKKSPNLGSARAQMFPTHSGGHYIDLGFPFGSLHEAEKMSVLFLFRWVFLVENGRLPSSEELQRSHWTVSVFSRGSDPGGQPSLKDFEFNLKQILAS